MDFHLFSIGLSHVFTWEILIAMIVGVTFGMILATVPGMSAALGVSLALPIVFTMNPTTGLIVLGSIWGGAIYGGSKAAILINTPGTPASITTTFDGYPMTRKGQAAHALFGALLASTTGGIVSTIVLLLLFQPLSAFALRFGPAQYFWLSLLGLTTVGAMTSSSSMRGYLGVGIGMLLSLIGLDPLSGVPRFTFGIFNLSQGINSVAAILGFFSFAQFIRLLGSSSTHIAHYSEPPGYLLQVIRQYIKRISLVLRSAVIGTAIGMIPGGGGPIATLVSYNEARRWDKHPERYGTGAIEGVLASEAAANATVGGSLIPLMALGIPDNPTAAVVMSGLLAFGLQPGPHLIQKSGLVVYTFIAALFIANFLMCAIGFFIMRLTGRILMIPKKYILPSVIVMATLGTYSLNDSLFDVGVMFACGLLAFLLEEIGIHPGTLALGIILGPIAENGFTQTLLIGHAKGSVLAAFFNNPISLGLIALIFLASISSYLANKKLRQSAHAPAEVPVTSREVTA